MIKRLFVAVLLTASIVFLSSCGMTQKKARGSETEILVVADSAEFAILETALSQVFEKEIMTPQPETLFTLKRIPLEQLNSKKLTKNIIIAAPLNSNSSTADYIKNVLDDNAKAEIKKGNQININQNDLWAKGQLVMILTAPTMEDLEFQILRQGDNFIYAFQRASDARVKDLMYETDYTQEDQMGRLLKDFGWTMAVPIEFRIAKTSKEDGFVWIRRGLNTEIERWVFVHWIKNADSRYLNADSIIAIRNRVTKEHYTTTDSAWVTLTEFTGTSEVNFNGRFALLTQGLWVTTDKYSGGPLINYTFLDEKTKTLYMLDGSVFAPKYKKRSLIQQMDVLLQTFKTQGEMKDEDVKHYLEKADQK